MTADIALVLRGAEPGDYHLRVGQDRVLTVNTMRVVSVGKGDGPSPSPGGADDSTFGLLLLGYNGRLEPTGEPDHVAIGSLGFPFAYQAPVSGFERFGSCYRWVGFLNVPQDGEYTFKGVVKSAGWFMLDGISQWSEDREQDPGNHEQFKPELTFQLTKGLHEIDVLLRIQGGEHVCQWHWIKPGALAPDSIDATECRPPSDWRTRIKSYSPTPAPVTQDYTTPSAAYKSPAIPALFGPESYWNKPIDQEPVDPNSDAIIASLNNVRLHPVFGEGGSGIPFEVIATGTPETSITFTYADESDRWPYPLPAKPLIEAGPTAEAGGDAHWIGYAPDENRIYEIFALGGPASARTGGSGAIFDLTTGERIPGWKPGWTSADAAGMQILPGLIRPEEVAAGEINHALRCTVGKTQKGFVYPASHFTHKYPADQFPNYPPMGARLRLKASTDISRFSPTVQTICRALKKYGQFVADNGSESFIGLCGVPDSSWDDDVLAELKQLKANDLEVVKMGAVTTNV